jgi:hypothetical protein
MRRIKIVGRAQPLIRDTGRAQPLVDPRMTAEVLEAAPATRSPSAIADRARPGQVARRDAAGDSGPVSGRIRTCPDDD